MLNKSSALRKLAMQAKKRLNGASLEKENCTKKEISTMTIYKNLYRNNYKIISYQNNDEEFYIKVKNILKTSPDSPTILKSLVNHDEYAKLDDAQKMNYMLNLAERYQKVKEKIKRENEWEEVAISMQ